MAVAFVNSATTTGTNTSSFVVNAPASIVAGNLLIMALATSTTASSGTTANAPSGWTAYSASPVVGSSTGTALYMWWKLATAGDVGASTYTATFTGTTSDVSVAATVVQYSGVDTTPNGSSSGASGTGTTSVAVAAPGNIQSGGVSVMFGCAAPDTSQTSLTVTMPGTSRVSSFYANDFGDGFGFGLAVSDSTSTASGNETVSVASEVSQFTVVLRAVGAPFVDSFTSSGTWNCPTGVTSATVRCWGGGGAGGTATGTAGTSGGGGAGGAFATSTLAVSAGTGYTVTVGAGGTAITLPTDGQTAAGGDTWFNTSSTIIAKGGAGGQCEATSGNHGSGGTGSSTGCIGTTVAAGGSGAAGTTSIGGGGGGGAGTGGAGGAASGSTGGTGTSSNGGDGGAGTSATTGGAGSNYGGGGGGARTNSGTDRRGGNGAGGLVEIQYTVSVNPTVARSYSAAVNRASFY